MGVTEQGRDIWRRVRAHQPIGAAIGKTDMVEIAQQILPFRRGARFTREVVEMLLHREGQERTKLMATDGCVRVRMIAFVRKKKFSTCSKSRYGLQRRHFRVRPQHEDSVETRLFGELSSVDLERAINRSVTNCDDAYPLGFTAAL
jgi:hypothetical protein